MMQKIWKIILIVIILAGAARGYMYRASQQKPVDTIIADTQTGSTDTTTTDTTTMTGDTTDTGDVSMKQPEGTDVYTIAANSMFGWKATKPTGFHTGTIAITQGNLDVKDGMIVGGMFTIDMNSIKLVDIDNVKLEGEIKNDFFEASKFGTASFTVTKVTMQGADATVEGALTIKDVTNTISFPANITMADGSVTATAQFAIDKDLWNLKHRDGMVNKYLEFDLNLTWTK